MTTAHSDGRFDAPKLSETGDAAALNQAGAPLQAVTDGIASYLNGAPHIGQLRAGPLASITDVAGVRVGHVTLDDGDVQTGITVVQPHGNDLFENKVPAAASVINGFGKSVGLVQIDELGVLETPIALSNTFAVGTLVNAQIREACARHPGIGRDRPTVNPLVFECNDGYLNNIRQLAVREKQYLQAYGACDRIFARGSVGAGRGMSCFDMKGGIGTASRQLMVEGDLFTVGVLVLANMGRLPQFILAGERIGARLAKDASQGRPMEHVPGSIPPPELGSIIMLIATDAPVDSRQLRRLSVRAGAGLARTGAVYGHGSGDISLAFSTAYTVPHHARRVMVPALLPDRALDPLFEAVADSVEQSILDALFSATALTGRDGNHRRTLKECLAAA